MRGHTNAQGRWKEKSGEVIRALRMVTWLVFHDIPRFQGEERAFSELSQWSVEMMKSFWKIRLNFFHMSLSLGTHHIIAMPWPRLEQQANEITTLATGPFYRTRVSTSLYYRTEAERLDTLQKRTYRSLDLPLWDRDFDRLRADALLFLLGGDSDESCLERPDLFLLVDGFLVTCRVSLVDELLLFSLEVLPVLDFFDDDDATVRS